MSDTIPQTTPEKQCLTCKKFFPATTEYFHIHKIGKYGLRAHCKACRNATERPKTITEIAPSMHKICTKCQRNLPATDEFFHSNKRKKDGFHQQCKDCKNTSLKLHRTRQETKERMRSYTKTYQSRPEVKERIRAYQYTPKAQERIHTYRSRQDVKEHRSNHGKIYRKRPEIQEHQRAHRKLYNSRPEIRERHRAEAHKRRALKKATQGTYTVGQIHDQHKRQKGKCYYCCKVLTKYHIDHVIPLSRGGTNDISNLVLTCPTCNLKKGNKLPHEFFEGGRLL